MDPDLLFLRRYEQIAALSESSDSIDLLDAAGTLSQMLCDKHSLMDAANIQPKLKVEFHVGAFFWEPDVNTALLLLEDGLDPETSPPGHPTKVLSKDAFLAHPIIWVGGRGHTVKDVIGHARNVAGGRHYDPGNSKEEYEKLAAASSQLLVGGYPVGIRQMKAIARVTLRALSPLAIVVRARRGLGA